MDPLTTKPKVLIVDDDAAVVAALRRQLRNRFDTVGAADGLHALTLVSEAEVGFAAVVSDLKMPGMGGLAFLERVSVESPDTSRLLLTGHADLDTAIDALNGGFVFRFLCKPCDAETLGRALDDAVHQHRLVTAERELLQQTLNHSIDALIETLALANPPAFSRALRVRTVVSSLLDVVEVDDRWQVEVAAMLSQVGAVTLPLHTAEKLHRGAPLSATERTMVDELPALALRLIADIPRLDDVRAVIRGLGHQGSGASSDVPLGSRILQVAVAFDELDAGGTPLDTAIARLRARTPDLDPAVVEALAVVEGVGQVGPVCEIGLHEMQIGMMLASDIVTSDELLLVGRGQTVSENLLARIRNFEDRIDPDARVQIRVAPVASPAH